LESGSNGLASPEAAQRLIQHGPNLLPRPATRSVLAIAATVSLGLGEHDDAIFIFLVLAINTTVGAAQEVRAEVALATASGLRPIARMQAGKAGSGIRASRHETGKRLRADSEIPESAP
jgi:P-type Ca2+ transporter type 2C